MVTREMAKEYISFVLNDALNELPMGMLQENATLVGWQCGFEPMFVAVQSYLPNVLITAEEAIDIASDFLIEQQWFNDELPDPDHVILGEHAREDA